MITSERWHRTEIGEQSESRRRAQCLSDTATHFQGAISLTLRFPYPNDALLSIVHQNISLIVIPQKSEAEGDWVAGERGKIAPDKPVLISDELRSRRGETRSANHPPGT